MKKNNLLLLSSLLLLASCGQVENPTNNESEQPSQIPTSEITPTEVPTSEVTPTEEVSSDIVEEDFIVDENGIKRYKFDESGYEEFTFFDVEDIYLSLDETYYLSKMLVKDASLDGVSYFIETPENLWNMSRKNMYGKTLIQYLKGSITEEEFIKIVSEM